MTSFGFLLIGFAAGLIIGGFAVYGFLFAWAIREMNREENDDHAE